MTEYNKTILANLAITIAEKEASILRLTNRVNELVDQYNALNNERHEAEMVVTPQQRTTLVDMLKDGMLKFKSYEELEAELLGAKDEIEKLERICEEKDAKITELRQELQANKDADTLLCDENKRLLESLNAKDAEIAKLRLMVPEVKPSEVYTEDPNKEAYRIKVDPSPNEDITDVVDPEHCCRDCRHANATGEAVVYCSLLKQENDANAFACGSFISKPRKKKLPEE